MFNFKEILKKFYYDTKIFVENLPPIRTTDKMKMIELNFMIKVIFLFSLSLEMFKFGFK